MPPPARPKLYHIVHVDRLASVVTDGALWCDAKIQRRKSLGTTIGMTDIKKRRLTNVLDCWPDLAVGDCVPFYFCPRSVMLFVIHKAVSIQVSERYCLCTTPVVLRQSLTVAPRNLNAYPATTLPHHCGSTPSPKRSRVG